MIDNGYKNIFDLGVVTPDVLNTVTGASFIKGNTSDGFSPRPVLRLKPANFSNTLSNENGLTAGMSNARAYE